MSFIYVNLPLYYSIIVLLPPAQVIRFHLAWYLALGGTVCPLGLGTLGLFTSKIFLIYLFLSYISFHFDSKSLSLRIFSLVKKK